MDSHRSGCPINQSLEVFGDVDERLAEAETLYAALLAKAAARRFPLEPVFGSPKVSVVELAPLAYLLGRDLVAGMREAETKAAKKRVA